MTIRTQAGPARAGSTERCANTGCGHTKRDHSYRRDHQEKGYRGEAWCHACQATCLYEPPADGDTRTIAVDFDGVIHTYSRGWADGTIYDPPIPGALTGLRILMQRDAVFIHTTRPARQVARWIEQQTGYGIECTTRLPRTWYGQRRPFWNERGVLLVTDRKLPAVAYVDDRAIHHTTWDQTLADLGVEQPDYAGPVTGFQDRGDAARHAAGIDGTAGDAQDIPHAFVRDDETGGCLLCGLAQSYRKHSEGAQR